MKIRQLLLASGLLALAGCNSTSGARAPVDYGDELETPDILLQDTNGKSVQYGAEDFTLAADAKQRDQQIKLDPLEQGLIQSAHRTAQVQPALDNYSRKVESNQQVEAKVKPVVKPAVRSQAVSVQQQVAVAPQVVQQAVQPTQPIKTETAQTQVQAQQAPREPIRLESIAKQVEKVIKEVKLRKETTADERALEMPDPLLGEFGPG